MSGEPCIEGALAGFFGKVPARGDFVRAGLPSASVASWDEWMSGALAASQAALADAWLDAWLQAPIWNFALAAGVCGPSAILGVWMPSMDRAGRKYPLMIALAAEGAGVESLLDAGGSFLDAAEQAGLDALDHDLEPDELARRVDSAARLAPRAVAHAAGLAGPSLWWTCGSPFVPASALALRHLPDNAVFATMLDARNVETVLHE